MKTTAVKDLMVPLAEYATVPEAFYAVKGMEKIPRNAAISLRSITPEGSERIVRAHWHWLQQIPEFQLQFFPVGIVRADGYFGP